MSRCSRLQMGRVMLVAIFALAWQPTPHAALTKRVVGNLVFWDQTRGFDAIIANADIFSEISPFWYHVDAGGDVLPYTTDAGASYEDPAILSFLKARGILIIPTVANAMNGVWDGPLVGGILTKPALAALNISKLVQLAVANGYDGIDLDYENLAATDRTAFTAFVTQLANALHAQGKRLTVDVYAKTSEPGTWDGPQAQDWRAIGQAADQVRIMAYEYHWATSGAGPVSPIGWVNDVLTFARSTIPAQKIVHGVPLYRYDWIGQSGVDHVWTDTIGLAGQYGAAINWDSTSASPWFEYVARRARHTVWFENGASTDVKLQSTNTYDVSGITLWRIGGEDPASWSALRSRFGSAGGNLDPIPPTVTIASPLGGAGLVKKQKILALASDNIAIARVEFFVNGAPLATDTSVPYVVYWNTVHAASGTYVIQAVAYDTSGNSAAATVTTYR